MTGYDSRPERNSLCACSHGVRCILDICAINIPVIISEDTGPDVESRVWAVGKVFGGSAAGVERMELGLGEAVFLAGLRDVWGVAGEEELHGYW